MIEGEVTLEEAVQLGAVDPNFYGRFFFPKACRQDAPAFHSELDKGLDSTTDRFVSAMVYRGGAKTTKLRLYISRRIAYRISNTIIVVGKSEDHSMKSIEWLIRAVKYNTHWASTFGLSMGKQTASDCEIICDEGDGVPPRIVRVLAYGIRGSVRGVNIDDWRPDLIVVDDPCDEENTATHEQRTKTEKLFFGALAESLAPVVDSPYAKMVLLQTVLNKMDLISLCTKDPEWKSYVFSCFDDLGNSRWPEREPTADLLKSKAAAVARNMLGLWLREKECKCVSEDTVAFPERWIQYWDIAPEGGINLICCDPTPPPKDGDRQKISKKLDNAVIMVLKLYRGGVYVMETYAEKAPDPLEFCARYFEMAMRWKCQTGGIETILFARTLKSLLDRIQQERRQYITVHSVEDRRAKETRIRQEVGAIASNGMLHVHEQQTELLEELLSYPDTEHDDFVDCLSVGLITANELGLMQIIEGEYMEALDDDLPALDDNWRLAI